MKICGGCKTAKELREFNVNSKRSDGKQSMCRECQKKRHTEYYHSRSTRRKAQIHERRNRVWKINQEFLLNYLLSHPCVDCGESRIATLQFDHVTGKKFMEVATMVRQGYSLSSIEAEIQKCEIRCANCHAVVTAERAGWAWRLTPIPLV